MSGPKTSLPLPAAKDAAALAKQLNDPELRARREILWVNHNPDTKENWYAFKTNGVAKKLRRIRVEVVPPKARKDPEAYSAFVHKLGANSKDIHKTKSRSIVILNGKETEVLTVRDVPKNLVVDPLEPPAESIDGVKRINAKSVKLIQHFESCFLKAYKDPVGVWTIGWGHTGLRHQDGTVHAGREITQAEADKLFRYDMTQFEKRVSAFVKVPLTPDQYGALVAFDFNTGGLRRSTLLKKLNAKDYAGAADEFLKWNKAGKPKKVLPGLTRRRRSERRLFLGKDPAILKTMAEVRKDGAGLMG